MSSGYVVAYPASRSIVSRSNIPAMSNSTPLIRTLCICTHPTYRVRQMCRIANPGSRRVPAQCSQNQDGMATFSSASSLGPRRSVTSYQKLAHRASTNPALQKRTMCSAASFLRAVQLLLKFLDTTARHDA